MTALCISTAHCVEVIAALPAQVHQRSYIKPRLWLHNVLHRFSFDELALENCHRRRTERSQQLPAFLFFPTGCMHGKHTCRIAWLHCIQVTLCVASSTASLRLSVQPGASAVVRACIDVARTGISATIQGNVSLELGCPIISSRGGDRNSKDVLNRRNPRVVTTRSHQPCGTQHQQRTARLFPRLAWSPGRMGR